MSIIRRFFEPAKVMEPLKDSDYQKIKYYRDCLTAINNVNNQSFYVIDFYKQTFDYVSNHPLFLCGYSVDQVKEWGTNYFRMVIPADDLKMIAEISEKAFGFFYKLPVENRTNCYISYDFRMIQPNGTSILVNHRLSPMFLTPKGDMWLALCQVILSNAKQPGNVVITLPGQQMKYKYSFEGKKFNLCETVPLTVREKEVLKLIMSGISTSEIASTLFVNLNTIKYHKKNIYRKLGIKNSIEVIHHFETSAVI